MATNATLAKANLSLTTQQTKPETSVLKVMSLRQRVEVLAREIFQGHDEFLGYTPE